MKRLRLLDHGLAVKAIEESAMRHFLATKHPGGIYVSQAMHPLLCGNVVKVLGHWAQVQIDGNLRGVSCYTRAGQ
jgi:hypothetical protein